MSLDRLYIAFLYDRLDITLWRPDDDSPWCFPCLFRRNAPFLVGPPYNVDDLPNLQFHASDLWRDTVLTLIAANLLPRSASWTSTGGFVLRNRYAALR